MADLNDPARLAELHHVLLRDDADATLDACVERATELARAPMALVSLVVRHIQLFRAHRGLPPELSVSCATSRSSSFCQLVVHHEAPLVVEDAVHDERVPKELVERYGIRAYAGVPVRVHRHVVGALCVLDLVPRAFEPRVVEGLNRIAAEVGARIEALESDTPPPSRAAKERIARLGQTARALERALLAIAPVIAEAQRTAATLPEAPLAAPSPDDLRAAVDCYRDMFAIAAELSEDAIALSRSAPAEAASELALATRSLSRDMVEISPLVRLAEGVLEGTLDEGAAAKAAHVVRDAFAAHETATAAVRRIIATVERARTAEAW
ncbi:GAF domain-containing protein [Sorangium sp. So ce1000]|uniref:GAF domain-containing protein n=1 Tax=Sorangium sp. So ce1000 TaxID=3133325 RepID=UPI003F619092